MMLRSLAPGLLMLLLFSGVKVSAQIALPRYEEHLVKEGETPTSICGDYGIKVKDFLMLNDFPPSVKLTTGQVVLIRLLKEGEIGRENVPAEQKEAESSTPTPEPKAEPKESKPKESRPAKSKIEKEAPSASPSTASTSTASTPKVSSPKEGRAPEMGPDGTVYEVSNTGYHLVKRRQNCYRIALIYGITIDQLMQLNHLSSTKILIGQKLKVR